MTAVDLGLGIAIVVGGLALLGLELAHPGALLFIPGSILIVGGFLYLLLPDLLLNSLAGPVIVLFVAVAAGLLEIPYYRYAAPVHKPMTTTASGLEGEEAVVTVDVVPNTLKGKVRVRSEIWSAHADLPIPAGTRVRVVRGEGVSVSVEPLPEKPSA